MQKRILMPLFVAFIAALSGPALASPSGSYTSHNSTTATLNLTANSFTISGFTNSFPTSVATLTSAAGSASSTSNTLSGTVSYQDPVTHFGCSFTTLVNKVGTLFNFTFNKAVLGGAGSTAVCTFTASRDTSTGTFNANATVSGF